MTTPKPPHDAPDAAAREDELPATGLADLASLAQEKLGSEPDKHGPAATRAMAAIVRDLKGMPGLVVNRESATRMRLGRKNKVATISLEYHPKILAIQVAIEGLTTEDPTAHKFRRYTLQGADWLRLEGGGDLFGDLREAILRLYPEL